MPPLPADLAARLRPAIEGRACCVTGGAGFIGDHQTDALLGRVTVIEPRADFDGG